MSTVILFALFFIIAICAIAGVMTGKKKQNQLSRVPEECRCNPYFNNPKGRIPYADSRNIEKIERFRDR